MEVCFWGAFDCAQNTSIRKPRKHRCRLFGAIGLQQMITQSVCSDSPYKNSTLSRKKEGVLFFAFCYKAANTEEIFSCSTKSAILS